jgi:hypothetical protein
MAQLKWISDSGHGWLEVPTQNVLDAGVVPSQYSYISDDRLMTYLEEDCDASKYLVAVGKHTLGVAALLEGIPEEYIDGDCWVRGLTHCAGWER